MTKEEIAQLLTSIKENETICTAEIPPTVPFNQVASYNLLKARASETAFQKKQEYKAYIENHIGGILLKGPYEKQLEFAKVAEEMGKTITFDAQDMYRRLCDVAFFMTGGKGSVSADQVALVFTEIRLLRRDLGVFRLADPDFNWMFGQTWKEPTEFANAFRSSLFRTNGLKLTQAALFKKAFDDSLATPIARTTIPVVILGMVDEEEEQFKNALPHGYTIVDLNDKEVDEEIVRNTFVTLRDTIKAKATQ